MISGRKFALFVALFLDCGPASGPLPSPLITAPFAPGVAPFQP